MPFTGTHLRTLDEKARLAIPKPFRDLLTGESASDVVIAPETEQALALFSVERFQQRAEEIRASSGNSAKLKTYLRLYFSQAATVEIDKQGRIRIPERLLAFAGLRQDVVLLGVNDHVELWDQSRWEGFLAENGTSFDEIAETL
jgi:MraZ protein